PAPMAPERGERALPAGTEGLPRAFLQSLRTLFDILDDRQRGHVHLREIESRWRGAEARELPAGPPAAAPLAPPAAPVRNSTKAAAGLVVALEGKTVANWDGFPRASPGARTLPALPGGVKGFATAARALPGGDTVPGRCGCARQLWGLPRRGGHGAALSETLGRGDTKAADQSHGDGTHPGGGDNRKHQRGRAEHRRHTITNGVDFSVLKHMKELEQEKDVLLQGLELVERAREWYHQHIQLMQERQRLLGKNKTSADFFPEGDQSHLEHLVPKLQEVNRCLGDLLSTASKAANPSSGLSKLIPAVSPASAGSQQAINMLKEQNRLLTKEVTDKSERITQLEQEKSALIKQLFEARARNNHETSQLDSTFI
ncbi:SAPC2 protein, partial [Crotophaga sulcirostris]|nr:SAPC2 protein [Crotophaga sulcirostris]